MIKFEFNRDNLTFIGLVIVVLMLLGQCSRNASLNERIDQLETEISSASNNLAAANDTVEVYKNRKGYLEAEIKSYQISAEELKKANAKLVKDYTSALSLNKNLKNVNTLLRAQLEERDSIIASGALRPDSTFTLEDSADYGDGSYRYIRVDGKLQDSTVNGTITLNQNISLWMAIENKKGVNSLKLSTKYPFENFDIQGIELVDRELNRYQKKGRWVVATGIGVGVFPSQTTVVTVSPTVGIIIGWSPKMLQF